MSSAMHIEVWSSSEGLLFVPVLIVWGELMLKIYPDRRGPAFMRVLADTVVFGIHRRRASNSRSSGMPPKIRRN